MNNFVSSQVCGLWIMCVNQEEAKRSEHYYHIYCCFCRYIEVKLNGKKTCLMVIICKRVCLCTNRNVLQKKKK